MKGLKQPGKPGNSRRMSRLGITSFAASSLCGTALAQTDEEGATADDILRPD